MKKKMVSVLVCLLMASIPAVYVGAEDLAEQNVTEKSIVAEGEICLSAADAIVSGQGINTDGEAADTAYLEEYGVVANISENSEIIFTVPDGIDGSYDIYLEIGRAPLSSRGTTPVSVTVNGKEYVTPAEIETVSNDQSDLYSLGKFAMAVKVELTAGDEIIVHGKAGFVVVQNEDGGGMSFMPAVGDLYLYPTGTAVAVGYDGGTLAEEEEVDESDPLSGLTILWLGSSVTYGDASGGYTMADEIAATHDATTSLKYAISGTTLVNEDDSSYVQRMMEIDTDIEADLFIVQLSTNDATQGKELGVLSDGTQLEDFDDTTIIGAIETIVVYVQETWGCPVIFYTGSYYESEAYESMIGGLYEVQEKWDIGIIDLWNDEDMLAVYGTEEYNSYMRDSVHPTLEGYVSWWTPKFEAYLTEFVSQ